MPSHATRIAPLQEKLLEESYSPVMLAKAVKNTKEQDLLRAAHVWAVPVPTSPSWSGGRQRNLGGADALFPWCHPGSGRGSCHPVLAVAGEDGPTGAGG